MGELTAGSPLSGYSGRWWRWEGAATARELDAGRDVYMFRWKPRDDGQPAAGGAAQVWLALTSKQQGSPFIGPRKTSDPVQAELELETNIMELDPSAPMFQPSIAPQLSDLGGALRTWAVDAYGFCTAPAGLPAGLGGTEGGAGGGAPWVATPLLRMPGADGQRWSVKLKYDPATGALVDTRHSWEAGPGELRDIRDAFPRDAPPPPPTRESPPCIDAWFASAAPALTERRMAAFSYSDDGNELLRAEAAEAGGGDGGGGGDAWWWGAPTLGSEEHTQVAEVWYPGSGAYARAPTSLAPLVAAGADAVLEAGALMPDGSLARWVLRYATIGDRRLRSATHQVFAPAHQ
ncbi:MAG: hypothetical protein J3K34DRAFT_54716 [Monoraphidium minutum]|nr:MAG: hypothetical protein J3K34DRAFT_54716 [Monoraphidium minutum]